MAEHRGLQPRQPQQSADQQIRNRNPQQLQPGQALQPQQAQLGGGQRPQPQVGRSQPKDFDAIGEGFDLETAKKFRARGPSIPLTAAQKLDFSFNPADQVSLVLMGTRSRGFKKQVDLAAKKGFKIVMKKVPFGDFKSIMRVFAVKPRSTEEGGMRK